MLPGRIVGANRFLGAPEGWNELTGDPCSTLPVRAEVTAAGLTCLSSAWQPTPEELLALQAGGSVILMIFQVEHPVVAVGVSHPPAD